ncbi:Pentatricopeptide repeat-containing protein [Hibiscus syriacus]|uniref:Pentatricopeptide repeat-containing protein n=1 Tax=Hibiscus syriacus TaxID=106335 RepID=A0A6A3A847_HIBSY|nr:pentatricopeptide repeat-containing protein At2g01390-like [Hibiscus syriacus]KAE8699977.1 Pentatricopeptide repeat-containing protein [Hibiscus syriacus]
MLRINYLHGLAASFRIWNRPIRYFHSLDQNKHRTPTRHKFAKTSKNPVKTLDVEPKVYMRDTISNIYKILRYSTWDSAETQLKQLPLKWDSFTVNQVLKTHPPMEKAWLFFNWVDKVRGFKHDQFTYTTMLDIFGEAGRVSSMKYLFQQMQEKGLKIDVVTYTSSLYWLSKSGDFDGAMETWEEMRGKRCFPTVVSYTAYMKVLFDNKRIKEGTDVYKEMLQSGISPNCHTYTVLMEYLFGAGKYEEALEIFNKMQEAGVKPDKAACNILVEKCCKAGETWPIIRILQYMKENFIVLRYPIFLIALETLRAAGESDALLRQVHPHICVECISNERVIEYKGNDSKDPLSLDRELVWVLLKRQNLLAIDGLLAELSDKNIQLDSEMMSAVVHVNCNRYRPDGALFAFKFSVKTGIELERTAYLALIGCLIRSSMFNDIVDIVTEMTSAGHSLGVYLASLLIYRLGCARRPSCAAKIFDLLPDDQKCVATYTALVGIYFAAGTADKGLKIYKTMQRKGIHPSLGTYCVLVAGLKKLGRVSNAETFQKEKKILQKDAYFRESIPIEEKICDLLFVRDVVS